MIITEEGWWLVNNAYNSAYGWLVSAESGLSFPPRGTSSWKYWTGSQWVDDPSLTFIPVLHYLEDGREGKSRVELVDSNPLPVGKGPSTREE